MADRSTVTYEVKRIKMALELVPNFQMLKKSLRDMLVSLPKKVTEGTAADNLLKSYEEFLKAGNFENAIDGFKKWTDTALDWLSKQTDEDLIAQRGRQGEVDTKLTLFGKELLSSQHAGELIKGSQLQSIIMNGLPDGFSEWDAFMNVTNRLRTIIYDLIPQDKRPKRPRGTKSEDTSSEDKSATETE